jgi:hypothetical protein
LAEHVYLAVLLKCTLYIHASKEENGSFNNKMHRICIMLNYCLLHSKKHFMRQTGDLIADVTNAHCGLYYSFLTDSLLGNRTVDIIVER